MFGITRDDHQPLVRELIDRIGHRLIDLRNLSGGIILRYHSVGENGYDSTPVKHFRKDVAKLSRYHEIVDLPQTIQQSRSVNSGLKIALTFDDGYEDFYRNVLPILREFHARATVFVVSDSIENQGFSHDGGKHRYMNREQLLDLVDEPLVSIGNHTRTHPRLGELDSINQIQNEIIGSKYKLEELGTTVDRFCYPHGSLDARSHQLVRASHEFAVTVEERLVSTNPDKHRLPRVNGVVNRSGLGLKLLALIDRNEEVSISHRASALMK